MTLFEKVKELYNYEYDFEKFAVNECVNEFDVLAGHYDEEQVNSLCSSDPVCEDCKKCWKLKYIENVDKDTNVPAKSDNVNHPNHYQGKHECIDIMRVMFGDEAVKGFCKCNAFKYRFRAGRKEENTAEQDIKKAEWYEEYLFRMEENHESDTNAN